MSASNEQNNPTIKQRLWFLLRFVATPLLLFLAGVALLAVLGLAQRIGWISSGADSTTTSTASAKADVDYICPMMCTPPQKEPGRCPVCAMELVPASGGASGGDERSVVVDAATRRVVNIQTASVQRTPVHRMIRAVGEVGYDEGKMKTISAYAAGRFDKMYVDYVGAVVRKGDRLAEFYSPELYSAQVEYLQALNSGARGGSLGVVKQANQRLQTNARQRLVELGMSDEQIGQVSANQKATTRLDIVAPIHGTVIERLATEGEYVEEGQPVFRLADLSTVWLLLELFSEDAAAVRYGQTVEARLKSMPEQTIQGRIAFIDPEVDKQSRTVSVRVVLENAQGMIRIGDYAKASIEVPISSSSNQLVYDPTLANKWISPRHPHITSDEPGHCKLCGVELVPASELGFTDVPQTADSAMVVPRNAVLNAADQSIVYVESETGRFEIRRVETGSTVGSDIVVTKGLAEGEKVATSGNFLLDSQMQLAGNPSLIDPSRAAAPLEMIAGFSAKELAEIQQLPDAEQALAIEQVICPVTEYKLGSMGVPKKVEVDGSLIFICCEACREDVVSKPDVQVAKIAEYKLRGPNESSSPNEFEVPELGEITPIAGGETESLSIQPADESQSFEIEVPAFDTVETAGGVER